MILTCRRLFAVSLIFLFLIPAAVSASQDARIFVTAVEDYHNGNYRSSQDRFNELVNRGVASAELFYNLGNCCFKQEDLGHCIWWYEKALQLNPGDPDIRFNLDYARTFVKDTSNTAPFPFYRIFFFWKELLPSSFLMVAALTLNTLFWILLTVRFVQNRKPVRMAGGLILGITVILTLSVTYDQYAPRLHRAGIILPDEAIVRSGLSDTAVELFRLHAGTRVSLEEQRGDYVKITFSDDKMGWVPLREIGVL